MNETERKRLVKEAVQVGLDELAAAYAEMPSIAGELAEAQRQIQKMTPGETILWCPDCGTEISQEDVDDDLKANGVFHGLCTPCRMDETESFDR